MSEITHSRAPGAIQERPSTAAIMTQALAPIELRHHWRHHRNTAARASGLVELDENGDLAALSALLIRFSETGDGYMEMLAFQMLDVHHDVNDSRGTPRWIPVPAFAATIQRIVRTFQGNYGKPPYIHLAVAVSEALRRHEWLGARVKQRADALRYTAI